MRDEFSAGVKQVLAHRAGYRCSKPNCRAATAGPSSESAHGKMNLGIAAHITAASSGPGARRYDPNLTSEKRRSASNGIWLCQVHAKEIDDDENRFSTDLLRAWKAHAGDRGPDVDDSHVRFLRARFECVAPPLESEDALTEYELLQAIEILKGSVLDVAGHDPLRSAGTVREVVDYFMNSPGLRERHGWSARQVLPGMVEVTYSYWENTRSAEAVWHVIPRTRSVRYRNRNARWMSWLSAD